MRILFMEYVAGDHVTNDLIQDVITVDKSLLELKNLPHHIVQPPFVTRILAIHAIFDSGNRVGFEVPDVYILGNVPDLVSTSTNNPVEAGILVRQRGIEANIVTLNERTAVQFAKHLIFIHRRNSMNAFRPHGFP